VKSENRPIAEVPFTLFQNAIIVPAVINSQDTVKLLLDTGWGPLALVVSATERLGLEFDPPDENGLGRTRIRTISIGNAIKLDPFVEVFPTASLAPLIGPHDGILSTAFFSDLVLQIDYPAKVLRFFIHSPISSELVTTNLRTTIPMILSPAIGALPFSDSIYFDGKPVRGLFDTGGSGGFVAMRQLIDRAKLTPIPDSSNIGIGMLSGDTLVQQRVQFTKAGRISLGPFVVDTPRVMLAPAQLGGDDWGHDLVIGYGFMRHYIVTFDYPGRKITFERPST